MLTRLTTLIFLIIGLCPAFAQPHLTGDIYLDLEKGYFHCQLTLSQIPSLPEYKVLLNKGMNVKHFKDTADQSLNYEGYYDAQTQGEAITYAFEDSEGETMDLPTAFSIEYVGAFPRYIDRYNVFDFKGWIAINDQTLRATEQTKWYPVLYDVINDRQINSYTYELNITLEGGGVIFVNGSAPKQTNRSDFKSQKAYPLFLFAGDFNFLEHNNNYILNDTLTKEEAKPLFENIGRIKNALAGILGERFEDKIFLIKHSAVNKRRKGSSWGFNTYPAFAFTGIKFSELVETDGHFSNDMYRYFGHEFAHNYFGNNVLSGKYSWFWLESFPEYLSFRIAREFGGEAFLQDVLNQKIANIEEDEFPTLSAITDRSEITEKYRYILGPLLLQCFEYKFGKTKMDDFLREILRLSKVQTLGLEHFKNAALKSGISKQDYTDFESKFIDNKEFKTHIFNYILEHLRK